jgi:hypothetical protein
LPETGVRIQAGGGSIEEVGAADVLVAIPTYNNADTIGPLVKTLGSGVLQFSPYKTVILQADGGSDDSTLQNARDALNSSPDLIQISYPLYAGHKLALSLHAIPGRESAFQTIFSTAARLGVQACCIIEPGIKSVSPDWVGSLVQPILESGFDFVAPQYFRHKYEGTLINGILYPLVRALFGKQIRQPIGNDFGFSGAFIRHCMSQNSWNREIGLYAVDLCNTLEAIRGGFKVCQALLGPRPRVRNGHRLDLSTVLTETVGSLFGQVELTAEQWQRVRGSEPVSSFGLRFDGEPEDPEIDIGLLIERYRLGFVNLQEIWGLILPPATLLELKRLCRQTDADFRFPDELWVRTIYDFVVAYHLRTIGREQLMGALLPLYLAWVASFILSARELKPSDVAARIEHLCRKYEAEKPYLISRWRWPDRFTP